LRIDTLDKGLAVDVPLYHLTKYNS